MEHFELGTVDLIIISGYFLIILFIGLVISKETETGDDFFLAGRKLGWAAIGFSLFASNISSSTLVGLTGQAYLTGLSVSNYEWMATIVLVFLSLFILPIYINSKISTVPEYLERRYNTFTRKYFSAINLTLIILVDTAGSLYGGALVVNFFFPAISIGYIILAIALIAGIYTSIGGLGAVVYTDILQAIVILVASSILLFAVLGQFDYSWSEAFKMIPKKNQSLIQPMDDEFLPWLGTFIGLPILGFYFWGTNQHVVQRLLGAKDLNNARWGALLGGFLKLTVLFLVVMPGAFAVNLFDDISNSDTLFQTMIFELIPPGVVGIVLAGLLAAVMSSVDSTLNASASLIVLDFVKSKRPNLTAAQTIKYGRTVIIVLMILSAIWAPQIAKFEGLWSYIQQVLTYLTPPIVTVFLLGIFWTRGTTKAAVITLIGGHILGIITMILQMNGWLSIHYTVVAGILTIICMIIYMIISFCSIAPIQSQLKEISWKHRSVAQMNINQPWYFNYRWYAILLLLMTFGIVIYYW